MAAREHRVSRRALLGAAFAPLLGAATGPLLPPALSASKGHPGLDPGSTFSPFVQTDRWIADPGRNDERWRSALARFRRAEAVLKAAAHEPDEDRYDRILGRSLAALKRLLRTPAPDLPALSLKIDLTIDHEVAELTGGHACLVVLKRDGRRLCAHL